MPDRAIAPLEELVRQLRGEADWMTPENPPGYQSGRIGQSRLDAERIEFLIPALASRFEALEAEIATIKAEKQYRRLGDNNDDTAAIYLRHSRRLS